MKPLLNLLLVLFLCSCASQKQIRGNYFFDDKSPFFYLAIAPTFSEPWEYEITSDHLILKEYDGLGGYEWGNATVTASIEVTKEQEAELRRLTVAAIKDVILEEEKGIDVIVMDGTNWFLHSDYGFGPGLVTSTNNPTDSFFELKNYLEKILEGINK